MLVVSATAVGGVAGAASGVDTPVGITTDGVSAGGGVRAAVSSEGTSTFLISGWILRTAGAATFTGSGSGVGIAGAEAGGAGGASGTGAIATSAGVTSLLVLTAASGSVSAMATPIQ